MSSRKRYPKILHDYDRELPYFLYDKNRGLYFRQGTPTAICKILCHYLEIYQDLEIKHNKIFNEYRKKQRTKSNDGYDISKKHTKYKMKNEWPKARVVIEYSDGPNSLSYSHSRTGYVDICSFDCSESHFRKRHKIRTLMLVPFSREGSGYSIHSNMILQISFANPKFGGIIWQNPKYKGQFAHGKHYKVVVKKIVSRTQEITVVASNSEQAIKMARARIKNSKKAFPVADEKICFNFDIKGVA